MTDAAGERVNVLIVNWNTAALLRNCLDSLHATDEASDLDIIVVDNSSTDNSVEMVSRLFPDVLVIASDSNEGFARANNRAFEKGASPYALLLNSDTEVPTGTIAYCRDYLRSHPRVGAVGCHIRNPDGTAQNSVFRYPSLRGVASTTLFLAQAFPSSPVFNHDRYGLAQPQVATPVEVVMGSFLMVRRADFEEDLLDDGYFMYSEEADLCKRLSRRGKSVVYLPETSVMHVSGASSSTSELRAWSDEAKKRALLRFLAKWDGLPKAYLANLIMLAGCLPRVLGWAFADLCDLLRGRRGGRLLKRRSLRFHVSCLHRPEMMRDRFTGPPTEISSDGTVS